MTSQYISSFGIILQYFLFIFLFYFDSDPTQSARWFRLEADPTPGEETQNSVVLGLENVTTLTLNLV